MKAKAWRGGDVPQWDGKRACPFVIELEGRDLDLTCFGRNVEGQGGPTICAYAMTDHERGDACSSWYHMCEIPLELATNCCWDFQMLVVRCAAFRWSYGSKNLYFAIRRHDWSKDVHRCYEELTLSFCPFCGARIETKPPVTGQVTGDATPRRR